MTIKSIVLVSVYVLSNFILFKTACASQSESTVFWDFESSLDASGEFELIAPSFVDQDQVYALGILGGKSMNLNSSVHGLALDDCSYNWSCTYADISKLVVGRSNFSLSFWMKTNNSGGYRDIFFSGSGERSDNYIKLTYERDSFKLIVQDPIVGSAIFFPKLPQEFYGEDWQHIAISIDRFQSNGVKFYLNGALLGEQNVRGWQDKNIINDRIWQLGGNSGWFSDDTYAHLDDFKFFHLALTEDVVQREYIQNQKPCAVSGPLSSESVSYNGIQFSWGETDPGYRLRYWEVNDDRNKKYRNNLSGGIATVDGLKPGATYRWQMLKECGDGESTSWVEGPRFTTNGKLLCPNVFNATAQVSGGLVTFSLDKTDSILPVYEYRVRYKEPSSGTWQVGSINDNDMSLDLSRISEATTYQFQIGAYCSLDYICSNTEGHEVTNGYVRGENQFIVGN